MRILSLRLARLLGLGFCQFAADLEPVFAFVSGFRLLFLRGLLLFNFHCERGGKILARLLTIIVSLLAGQRLTEHVDVRLLDRAALGLQVAHEVSHHAVVAFHVCDVDWLGLDALQVGWHALVGRSDLGEGVDVLVGHLTKPVVDRLLVLLLWLGFGLFLLDLGPELRVSITIIRFCVIVAEHFIQT